MNIYSSNHVITEVSNEQNQAEDKAIQTNPVPGIDQAIQVTYEESFANMEQTSFMNNAHAHQNFGGAGVGNSLQHFNDTRDGNMILRGMAATTYQIQEFNSHLQAPAYLSQYHPVQRIKVFKKIKINSKMSITQNNSPRGEKTMIDLGQLGHGLG